jgi:hypothetical protein
MNRRTFVKCSATGGLVLATAPAVVMMSGCDTNWVDVVLSDIPVAVNIVESILSVVSTATGNGLIAAGVSSLITVAVNALSAALAAIKDAITAYNSNKTGGLSGVIDAIKKAQQDAKGVMAALPAGTLSATWQLVIIAGLGTTVTILSAIQALIPGAAPARVNARVIAQVNNEKVVLPSANAVRVGFHSVLLIYGYEDAIR